MRIGIPKNVSRETRICLQKFARQLDNDVTPTFANVLLTDLTASRLTASSSTKTLESVTDLTSWIGGTANQVIVTDDSDGTVTLSLPQDIHTSATPTFARQTLTDICLIAGGANFLRVTGLQTDGTAMSGTLRGAYIDVSNGSTAATGTIRGMELKARTEAPGDEGNDVNVLEGLSISADSKDHSVTTMRAAEFILDGSTGGTITEAVGLRIANNLQANKATASYGLQIYRDSFDYTYDISLSLGGHITGDSYVNQDVRTTASPTFANVILTNGGALKVADGSPQIVLDNTNGYIEMSGYVGIDTDTPAQALDVVGSIYASTNFRFDNTKQSMAIGALAGGDTTLYTTTLGYGAGFGSAQNYCTQLGRLAGSYNTGTKQTCLGVGAGVGNTAVCQAVFGHNAGRSNTGNYQAAFGYSAGMGNIAEYQTASGYLAGQWNKGIFQFAFGSLAGQYNTGSNQTSMGTNGGKYNTGDYLTSIGNTAASYNDGDNNTAVGYGAFNTFTDDAGSAVTFDFGDVNVADNTVTIIGHGLGGNNTYHNLKFAHGTSSLPGIDDGINQWKVISADILEVISDTITGQGTGTGHTLTPKVVYSNSTALGYEAEPDASNQVMLGDGNVTEVKSTGLGNFGGAKIGDGGVTDYSEFETDGTLKFNGAATVWNDANVGAMALTVPVASQPDEGNFMDEDGGDTEITTWAYAVGEKSSGAIEFPHDYKEGSDIIFHVHWQGIAEPTGTDNVKWQLTYSVAQMESTLDAATTIAIEAAYDTQYEFKLSNFPTITGTNFNIGDQFVFTIERIIAAGDAYAGDALIATVGFHYECDTIGSRQTIIK